MIRIVDKVTGEEAPYYEPADDLIPPHHWRRTDASRRIEATGHEVEYVVGNEHRGGDRRLQERALIPRPEPTV
jgi:hypothetical protein